MKLIGQNAIAKRHQEIFDGFFKGTIFKAEKIDIRFVSKRLAIVLVDWKLMNLKCMKGKPCPKEGTFTHTFYRKDDKNWVIESTQNTVRVKK